MADLIELIVSNSSGQISGSDTSGNDIKGTICMKNQKEGFYLFYAIKDESTTDLKEITLTMPVGGGQNGLLRLPRVGEKILVAQQGNRYYLMAYLPDTSDMEFREGTASETEANEITSSEALTLRYKSPNAFPKENEGRSKQEISEFKISTQQTYWPNEKNADSKDDFPYIDRVDVTSAGDVITTAQNYNEVNASRIGLFAGVQDELSASKSKALTLNSDTSKNNGLKTLPLDNKAAGNSFGRGDVQIRADNTFVVRAKNGIQLQCGRSMIKIDDSGISITSAKIDPAFLCGEDSTISVTSLNGVTVIGDSIDMKAKIKYSLSEQLGGSLTSFAGMTRMSTHDYRVTSFQSKVYMKNIVGSFLQAVRSEYVMATSTAYKHSEEKSDELEDAVGVGNDVFRILSNVWNTTGSIFLSPEQLSKNAKATGKAYDASDYLLGVMNLIFGLKNTIYSFIDAMVPKENREDGTYGDAMSIIDLTINYTLLEIMAIYSYIKTKVKDPKAVIGMATIGVKPSGLDFEGQKLRHHMNEEEEYNGPLCGIKTEGTNLAGAEVKSGGMAGIMENKGVLITNVLLQLGLGLGAYLGSNLYTKDENADYVNRLQEL